MLPLLKKEICLVIIITSVFSVSAQTFTDHNKKDILTILSKESKRFSYSLSSTSASLTWNSKAWNEQPYVLASDKVNFSPKKDSSLLTSVDENRIFVTVSLKNVNSTYKDFFTNKNQPTVELGISYAFNSVKWINWSKLKFYAHNPFKQWDLFVKAFIGNTFSNYFDTLSKEIRPARKMPFINYGLQTDFIGYNKRFWIAITGTISKGMLTDNLKSYQDKASQPINLNPIIIPTGNSVGKYGPKLDKNQTNARVSFSTPIFLGDIGLSTTKINRVFFSKLSLIPFYAPYGGVGKKWEHLFGGTIGVLKTGYNSKSHSAILIKPFLEIGIDWQTDSKTKNGLSSPFWIIAIKGSI